MLALLLYILFFIACEICKYIRDAYQEDKHACSLHRDIDMFLRQQRSKEIDDDYYQIHAW